MKPKGKLILAAMVSILLLTGCGQPAASPSPTPIPPTQTQVPTTTGIPASTAAPAMELVPFTSQALSIRGAAPAGWQEINPGHFAGAEWPIDQLIHEVYPGMTIANVTATAVLPRLGRDALPEPTGMNESGAFTWDLYAIDIKDPNAGPIIVDLAMTETDTGVYLVVMVTGVDEHDPLHEAVFIPAVEACEPIVFDQRDLVTVEELLAPGYTGDGPVNHAFFLPMGNSGSARHELEGTLTVPEFKMFDTVPVNQVKHSSLGYFPGFSAKFLTYEGNLVPVQREVILRPGERSFWKIILSPGRVWSEPGDDGHVPGVLPLCPCRRGHQ